MGARVASSTTKSLPAPCILVKWSFIAGRLSPVSVEVDRAPPAGRVLKRLCTHRYCAGFSRMRSSIQRFMRAVSASASSLGQVAPRRQEAHAVALAAGQHLGEHRLHHHVQQLRHAR